MSAYRTYTGRRFYRSADRAVLGGVCAGIADYFGFNLRVLRILAVIAFIFAMPMAIIAYLAIVMLIPARAGSRYEGSRRENERDSRATHKSSRKYRKACRKERKYERRRAREEAKLQEEEWATQAANEVSNKCQALDQRLADLEKHITSSQYQLDREIRNL